MNEFEKAVLEEQTSHYGKGQLIKGRIVKILGEDVFVDIGQKVEAVIKQSQVEGYKEGDEIEAYFTGKRSKDGYFILNRKDLIVKDRFRSIKELYERGEKVKATVTSVLEKGYTVDVEGFTAFMPKSQSSSGETFPVGYTFESKIIKLEEREKGINLVVSRKAVLDQEREEERKRILSLLKEGQTVKVNVKKVLEKGLIVSIEGKINGFLPKSELSWEGSVKPEDFKEGQQLEVMIIEIRKEQPIFSLKRLTENPWEKFDKTVGDILECKVKEIVKDGIVVEVGKVEGFIPNIQIAHFEWDKAKKNYREGQTLKVKIIELDKDRRRLRLSIKELQWNPVEKFLEENPVGSVINAKVKNVKQKVAFLDLGEIEGILRLEDATKNINIKSISSVVKENSTYQMKVLGSEKDKIILGLKQVLEDKFSEFRSKYKVGDVVEFQVKKLIEKGSIVDLEDNLEGFIPVSEISKERINIPSDILSLHQRGKAKIIRIEPENKKIILSIKQMILDEERRKKEEERKRLEEEKKWQEENKKRELLEKLSQKQDNKDKEESSQFLGTLGEILKKKLEEKR
ncbi:MAG: S1 RNA-binding domain-containing protein [Hydrogenothermaceae bacterium]|nr:S1 RNA-binding domain-containing protein [Hydrogenothermaceae bacterium]